MGVVWSIQYCTGCILTYCENTVKQLVHSIHSKFGIDTIASSD